MKKEKISRDAANIIGEHFADVSSNGNKNEKARMRTLIQELESEAEINPRVFGVCPVCYEMEDEDGRCLCTSDEDQHQVKKLVWSRLKNIWLGQSNS